MICSHGIDHPELGNYLPCLYIPAGASITRCMCKEKKLCQEIHQRQSNSQRVKLPSLGRSKKFRTISDTHRRLVSELLQTNLPKDKSKHFLSSLHFHPSLYTTDGSVFSYIHDEKTAIDVYGNAESAGKYVVPSSGGGFSIRNCWFALPTCEPQHQNPNESILISDDEEETGNRNSDSVYHDSTSCHCCSLQDNLFLPPSLLQDNSVIISDDEGNEKDDADDRDDNLLSFLDTVHEVSPREVSPANHTLFVPTPDDMRSVTNEAQYAVEDSKQILLKNLCAIGLPTERDFFDKGAAFGFAKEHPSNYKKSRKADLKLIISAAMKGIAKIILPNCDEDEALNFIFEECGNNNTPSKTGAELLKLCKEVGADTDSNRKAERRSWMSIAANASISRLSMEKALDQKITKDEWTRVRMHCRHPGVGKPLEVVKHRRSKVADSTIDDFLQWAEESDILQNLAFGHKIFAYSNGTHVALPSVKMNSNVTVITKQYFQGPVLDSARTVFPQWFVWEQAGQEGRCSAICDQGTQCYRQPHSNGFHLFHCSKTCPITGIRCFKEAGHDGNHQFTPEGCLSPSSLQRILISVTTGTLKSLAGLDDIDTYKGTENFERMKSMADILCNLSGQAGALKPLLEKIERVVVFHKTDFHRHLDLALTETSKHCCTCIRCGFHLDNNPIECPLRTAGKHIGPCSRCQEGFEVISKLYSFYSDAMSKLADNCNTNTRIVDDLATFKDAIDEILRNFEDYRAHLVHKHDESHASKDRMKERVKLLEEMIIAILTSDHKMKILEFYHREGQRGFFGKRGTSCLGMGVKMKPSSTAENSHLAQYHLFFSDDTTQDAHSVNCAKKILFEHILKPMGVEHVDSSADGAGCLKSNVAKAMMSELTGVITEKTFHTSPLVVVKVT